MSAPGATAGPAPGGAAPSLNPHRAVRVIKVVVNAGVGESGEPRTKAERVLQMVTHQKPVPTRAHSTNRDFGIRQGQEIGAKVTLRGDAALDFLRRAFDARDRQFDVDSIDRNGNFSFGIADYTDFSGLKYDRRSESTGWTSRSRWAARATGSGTGGCRPGRSRRRFARRGRRPAASSFPPWG